MQILNKESDENRPPISTSPVAEGKMVVELKGKCFNTTLAIQKHERLCPWCSDPSEFAVVRQVNPISINRLIY